MKDYLNFLYEIFAKIGKSNSTKEYLLKNLAKYYSAKEMETKFPKLFE